MTTIFSLFQARKKGLVQLETPQQVLGSSSSAHSLSYDNRSFHDLGTVAARVKLARALFSPMWLRNS